MDQLQTVHHQTIRCSARGAVLRDYNWDHVTCDDCWAKRRSNSKLTKVALIIFGVCLLVVVSCAALVVGLGDDDPPPRTTIGTTSTSQLAVPRSTSPPPTATINLAETEGAILWVYLYNSTYGLGVRVDPQFDVEKFGLSVFVDGEQYCNTSRIYTDDGFHDMGCGSFQVGHQGVMKVSVQTRSLGDLRCERNVQSKPEGSIFACAWR